jgi:hypothetical protein
LPSLRRAVGAVGETLGARLDDLVAPAAQQALRDVVPAADLRDRAVPADARQHELELLLGGERAVLALVAQHGLLTR